jgi:hypothetical protein
VGAAAARVCGACSRAAASEEAATKELVGAVAARACGAAVAAARLRGDPAAMAQRVCGA